jgi:hypothetical protein
MEKQCTPKTPDPGLARIMNFLHTAGIGILAPQTIGV